MKDNQEMGVNGEKKSVTGVYTSPVSFLVSMSETRKTFHSFLLLLLLPSLFYLISLILAGFNSFLFLRRPSLQSRTLETAKCNERTASVRLPEEKYAFHEPPSFNQILPPFSLLFLLFFLFNSFPLVTFNSVLQ